MKYIQGYSEKLNENMTSTTISNIFKKKFGTYESPIWIHIKIFDNGIDKNCFIENDWVGVNSVNVLLMKELSERLDLNLIYKFSVNRFKFEMLEPICGFFRNLGLEINEHELGKGSTEITIKGKMSEKDIKNKLKN